MEQENKSAYFLYLREMVEVRKHWNWFLWLGIFLIILGSAAIIFSVFTTLFTIVILGTVLLIGGVAQVAHSFWTPNWSGFFISLLLGVLYLVIGFLTIANPALAAASLTLLIAAFFFVGGLFRMIASVAVRFDHWGWVFVNGLISFLLGYLIFAQWPISGLWVIGLFIGIDLLLIGWAWTILALSARKHHTLVK